MPLWLRERMTSARVVIKTQQMQLQPVEIRAFIDQPRATAASKTIGNASFAGTIGFVGLAGVAGRPYDDPIHCPQCASLGHTMEHTHHEEAPAASRSEGERFDVELDITDAVRKVDKDSDQIALKLVAMRINGDLIPAEDVLLDDIEFVVE